MRKRILVIGSSGFIGMSLCNHLLLQNDIVTGIDLKATDNSSLLNNFIQANYQNFVGMEELVKDSDCIFHLSSSTTPAISNRFPLADVDENLKGTLSLLELMRKYPRKKLIFISSGGTVYGEAKFTPIRETHETNPVCSYGIVKLAIEKYIQMYGRLYGINYLIYRLSNPYGPQQLNNNGQGLIANLILRISKQEAVEIWGDGSIIRDYIYIDDAITAMIAGIEYSGTEYVFNLSSGKGYSAIDIIPIIESLTEKNAIISFKETRNFDIHTNILDINRIKRSLNWKPVTSLTQGIIKTINGKSSMQKYDCIYTEELAYS